MSRDVNSLKDTFWENGFCFVCEERYRDLPPGKSSSLDRHHFEKFLAESGRLPDLGGAPMASWLLARLARLSGRRFPIEYGDVCGSDGADYWLRFYVLNEAAVTVGVVGVTGKKEEIYLYGQQLGDEPGETILDAFIAALLRASGEVARAKVIVQYTEMTDPAIVFHIPQVYGWDGEKYFNEGAPQYIVDPSDYE